MSWSLRSFRPDSWELCWTTTDGDTFRVGECCWMHLPQHPAVAMQRISDRLNAQTPTAPADGDGVGQLDVSGWWCQIIAAHPEQRPLMWVGFYHQDVEAMVLVWDRVPTHHDRWHARVVAALSAGDGLPAVTLATPVRRSA